MYILIFILQFSHIVIFPYQIWILIIKQVRQNRLVWKKKPDVYHTTTYSISMYIVARDLNTCCVYYQISLPKRFYKLCFPWVKTWCNDKRIHSCLVLLFLQINCFFKNDMLVSSYTVNVFKILGAVLEGIYQSVIWILISAFMFHKNALGQSSESCLACNPSRLYLGALNTS